MVYFVADIHLGAGSPEEQQRVEQRFLQFLRAIESNADTVVLAGDIFDFWFEYKRVVPQGHSRILGQLASMHDKGIRLIMFTGNHDMWVGDYLTRECGIEIYTTPQLLSLCGKSLFVAHGDNINVGRKPMLRLMNSIFRSKVIRALFSWLIHPDIALRFGHWWSGKSRKAHRPPQSSEVLQPLIEYANEQYRLNPDIDYFVFGHLHYADDSSLSPRILFLGDWHSHPNYISLNDKGDIKLEFLDEAKQ